MARMLTTTEIKLRELYIKIGSLEYRLKILRDLLPCNAKDDAIKGVEEELSEKKAEAAKLEEDM